MLSDRDYGSPPARIGAKIRSERDPVVRDASLRDAPHHEDRFDRPRPEERPKGERSPQRSRGAPRSIEVVHSGWSLILAPMRLRGDDEGEGNDAVADRIARPSPRG